MARSPVARHALAGAACDARAWRQAGRLHVAVAVKATLKLTARGAMSLTAPQPVLTADEHHDDSPAQSLRRAGELLPWRRRVDVTAHGFACTAGGEPLPATTVRLAIYRGQQALVDKTLYVYGDRTVGDDGQPGPPEPFSQLPIVYERALQTDANPAGVSPDKRPPNFYDPKHPDAAAGFGPISRYAKARRHLIGGADRKALEADVAELPDGFDGAYFQAAPPDQQLSQLHGDEWVLLDGFDPDHRRIASQLPSIRAEALVTATDRGGAAAIQADAPLRYRPIRLAIDGLHLDGEQGLATVIWRGSFLVADETALPALCVVGAVALGPQTIAWPQPSALAVTEDEEASEGQPDAVAAAGAPSDQTASIGGAPTSAALPFESRAPWGEARIKPIPQVIGAGAVTYADASGATVTLSAEERERIMEALPFDSAGTRALSPEQQHASAERPEAPFRVAGPGEGRSAEAPEGAPFAQRPARPVRRPVGDHTMDLAGAERSAFPRRPRTETVDTP